ncbi:MAG: hypothetical protein ACI9VM_000895 [Candidatus Azotimanducaceae bacterium]|jgi:hypothetical protein
MKNDEHSGMQFAILFVFISYVCVLPIQVDAAIIINEIAWPHTNFGIVLSAALVVGLFLFIRTKGCQSKCLGKMGIVSLVLLFPLSSSAAVFINEIAWMGSTNSANDEWIELYNDGGNAASLDGWMLSDGMNLEIDLIGTLGAGSYGVLERTDDTSVSGSAFLIYTGALSNTGSTLTLKRGDGSIEDQTSGGDNWENVGGDNATKETAQYTTSGWVTGNATPGYENTVVIKTENTEDDTFVKLEANNSAKSVKNSTKSTSKTTTLTLLDLTLELTVTAPSIAYVHQPVTFSIEPKGIGDVLLKSITYNWNFGDLTTGEGKTHMHQYEYPGTYVVVIAGGYKRHHATVRHEITVLPVTFSMTKNTQGDLQVHNDSRYEVDISGYSIRGDSTIVFPENTILLPNATLTIPKSRIGDPGYLSLFDQEQMVVASTRPTPTLAVVDQKQLIDEPLPVVSHTPTFKSLPQVSVSPNTYFTFNDGSALEEEVSPGTEIETFVGLEVEQERGQNTNIAIAHEAEIPLSREKLPYLGLIGILSLGILAVYAGRSR